MLEADLKEDWIKIADEEHLYVYEDNSRFFVLVDTFVVTISMYVILKECSEENLFSDSNTNVNSMTIIRVSLFYRYLLEATHHMVRLCTL